MNEQPLAEKPKFYKSVAGNAGIERLSDGSEVNRTNLPIIGHLKTIIDVTFTGSFQKDLRHDLGKKHDLFARVRQVGTTKWITMPAYFPSPFGGTVPSIFVQNVDNDIITIEFDLLAPSSWEIEIYFISFSL